MAPLPAIRTSRLRLRAFTPADAGDLHAYLSEQSIYRFEPGAPIDRAEALRLATEMAASPDFWAVELRAERKVIGQVYFKQTEPHLHT